MGVGVGVGVCMVRPRLTLVRCKLYLTGGFLCRMSLRCSGLYLAQFRFTSPHLLASGDGSKKATIAEDVYIHPSAKIHPTAKVCITEANNLFSPLFFWQNKTSHAMKIVCAENIMLDLFVET